MSQFSLIESMLMLAGWLMFTTRTLTSQASQQRCSLEGEIQKIFLNQIAVGVQMLIARRFQKTKKREKIVNRKHVLCFFVLFSEVSFAHYRSLFENKMETLGLL